MLTDEQIWNDNKLTHGDCERISEALGFSPGEKHSKEGDSRGLGFTVAGGYLTTGKKADEWLAKLNGSPFEDIAIEAILRKAVIRKGRWGWRLTI